MSCFRKSFALVLLAAGSTIFAQSSEVSITIRPHQPCRGALPEAFSPGKRIVGPAKLTNSSRLESLVRGGNLYLSVEDVIALTLENNLDIAMQRYGPFLAREVLRRAEGGGFLRQVDTPVAAGPTSVSTAGVSVNANGLGGGAGVGRAAASSRQIGPTPPNLDPTFSRAFSSATRPRRRPTRC